jgi:hypothetical protein
VPWLILVILATQEAEIRRLEVRSQLEQIIRRPFLEKNPSQKRVQSAGPEFKPQYDKKPKNLLIVK